MSYKTDIKETATEISLFGKITINKSTGIITVDNFNASQISLGRDVGKKRCKIIYFWVTESRSVTLKDESGTVALISDIGKITASPFVGLPASPVTGWLRIINDASSITYRATASGGGSDTALVMYNGTNWIYH
jgi:hypothetical protein